MLQIRIPLLTQNREKQGELTVTRYNYSVTSQPCPYYVSVCRFVYASMWVLPFAVSVLRLSGPSASQPLASETISLPFHYNRPPLTRARTHARPLTHRHKHARCFRGATVKCWLNCGLPTPFFPASHRRGAQGSLCDALNRGRIGVEIRETRGVGGEEKKSRGGGDFLTRMTDW